MPGILDFLKSTGHGVLTGASMLSAMQQGKDPFALFTERDIRQQQLHDLEQASILKQAAALQDPAARAYLMQNPQAARAFGLPTETMAGASANFPVQAGGLPTAPAGYDPSMGGLSGQAQTIQPQGQMQMARQVGLLPPEVETSGSLARQASKSKMGYFDELLAMAKRQEAMGGGGGMQVGFGPSGPSVTPAPKQPTRSYKAGTINPVTNEPYKSGELNPSGEPVVVQEPGMTSSTRTMVEAAPKVKSLIKEVRNSLAQVQTGPISSRLQNLATGLGYGNKEWKAYKTNTDLLTTLLMRMHVGARGGEYIAQHFKDILNAAGQSAENMNAALDVVEQYANDVESQGKPKGDKERDKTKRLQSVGATEPPPGAAAPSPAPTEGAGAPIQGMDDINTRRAKYGFPPMTEPYPVHRAGGGPVLPGQSAMVGERGPEIVQGRVGGGAGGMMRNAQPAQWAANRGRAPQGPFASMATFGSAPQLNPGGGAAPGGVQNLMSGATPEKIAQWDALRGQKVQSPFSGMSIFGGGAPNLGPGGGGQQQGMGGFQDILAQIMQMIQGGGGQGMQPKQGQARMLKRAKGGDVPKDRMALVGEHGPELIKGPATVYPIQVAQNTPWSPQPTQQPMQLQPPVQQPPMRGGLTQGQGLSDEDILRARQGYQVIMGPNGPVAIPR